MNQRSVRPSPLVLTEDTDPPSRSVIILVKFNRVAREGSVRVRATIAQLQLYVKKALFNHLSVKERIFFIKRLSFLISSGMPLVESLEMIRDQQRANYLKEVLTVLIDDVASGKPLSRALERFRSEFGDFAINIIHFGESSGILSENLEYLALELRRREALQKKIIGASIYPMIVILGVLGVVSFLMIYLFPKILPVFQSLHMRLPLSTRILIFLSNGIRHHWFLIISTLTTLAVLYYWLLRNHKRFSRAIARILIRLPIVGGMIRSYNLASITRTLGLLLKSNVSLSESLSIVSRSAKNMLYRSGLEAVERGVDRGEALFTCVKRHPTLFPDMFVGIVAVGERSGSLSESLLYLSNLYEEEVDDITKNISTLVEPILMIVMGLLVGFIAISIIAPIYGITSNLNPK